MAVSNIEKADDDTSMPYKIEILVEQIVQGNSDSLFPDGKNGKDGKNGGLGSRAFYIDSDNPEQHQENLERTMKSTQAMVLKMQINPKVDEEKKDIVREMANLMAKKPEEKILKNNPDEEYIMVIRFRNQTPENTVVTEITRIICHNISDYLVEVTNVLGEISAMADGIYNKILDKAHKDKVPTLDVVEKLPKPETFEEFQKMMGELEGTIEEYFDPENESKEIPKELLELWGGTIFPYKSRKITTGSSQEKPPKEEE